MQKAKTAKNGRAASPISRREITLRNKWAADGRFAALERRVQALERRVPRLERSLGVEQ